MEVTNDLLLEGRTLVVVEDEPLLGMDIAASLEEAGAVVCGPCASNACARDAIARIGVRRIDAAVLDVHLGQETCEATASFLKRHEIPFVLHTGDARRAADLVARLDVPVVPKPAMASDLIEAVHSLLAK